jgi:hypothetical protein
LLKICPTVDEIVILPKLKKINKSLFQLGQQVSRGDRRPPQVAGNKDRNNIRFKLKGLIFSSQIFYIIEANARKLNNKL